MGLSFPGTGMQVDKLWENSNPAAAFAAQKIPLDLSAYDAVYVVCALQSTYSQRKCELIMKGNIGSVQVFNYDGRIPGSVRRATVSPDGVTFTEGYYYNWSTTAYDVNNQGATPIAIYGVKF